MPLCEVQLLAIGLKNCIAPIRAQWKLAAQARHKYKSKGVEARVQQATHAAKKAAEEVTAICKKAEALLKQMNSNEPEVKALFAKIAADYKRYAAEVAEDNKHMDVVANAYKTAQSAAASLPPTSAVKLGIALNYSVFAHDLQGQPAEACRIAENALQDLGSTSPDGRMSHIAATMLQGNLQLWKSENTARLQA